MQQTIPAARAPISRYFTLCAYWFGTSLHWMLLLTIVIQSDVVRLAGNENKGTNAGWLMGALALIPLVLPPFLGIWSDRVGKRLLFMIYGTIINVLGLGVMIVAGNLWLYAFGYFLVQLGNSVASSPYTALVPDAVPEKERGAASGVMGLFQLLGQIVGGVAAFALAGNRVGLYIVIALVLVFTTWITVQFVKEPQLERDTEPSIPWLVFLQPEYQGFRWVFLTRAFMETGRFAVQPFLFFYMRDVVQKFNIGNFKIPKNDPELAVTALIILLSVTAAATAIWSGPRSDRFGKKSIIYVAGTCMALGCVHRLGTA